MPTPYQFNIVLEVIARASRQLKGIQIRVKEVKVHFFADNMILYIRDLQIPPGNVYS